MVKKTLADVFLFLVMVFMYIPIIFVIIYSFSGNAIFVFDKFTFASYIEIFTSPKTPKLLDSLKNTLIIASISSIIATIMGTFAAIGIFHMGRRAKKIVSNVNQLPVINSEIVMAVSLLLFFNAFHFPSGYLRLILAHTAFCTPYVVLSVMPKLIQLDPNVYEAALDLGASPTRALWTVMLPLLVPGIISGFVMSFTLSMDDFIITQINKGMTEIDTLSTYIYNDARVGGLEPFWLAVFSIIFVVILAVMLTINLRKASRLKSIQNKAI
jgi:ABC-type spermidine/putrescine transport system, permease component II